MVFQDIVGKQQHYPQVAVAEMEEWLYNKGLVPGTLQYAKPLRLIGMRGYARSGKDTAAGLLKTSHTNVDTVAFADPIRDAMRALFDFTDDHLHGRLKEVKVPWIGKSPRELMQTLGTEWGREIVNQDIWLLIARRKIVDAFNSFNHVIVTDVRFENEADFIRDMGGVIWHIERDAATPVASHKSEAGVAFKPELGDIKIDNNGSLDDLLKEVLKHF